MPAQILAEIHQEMWFHAVNRNNLEFN